AIPILAINSFTKAENDSNEDKCPITSFNKGNTYKDLYEKNGEEKYLHLAINSFTKAEKDSNEGKYPEASNNKGASFYYLYNKTKQEKYLFDALTSCTKAEEDNDGKLPIASYGKGIVYGLLGKSEQAIESYKKAINDSPDNIYPDAHLQLAEIYLKYDENQSMHHAF